MKAGSVRLNKVVGKEGRARIDFQISESILIIFIAHHVVGEFDLEGLLERHHQLDRAEGGQAGIVEVGLVGDVAPDVFEVAGFVAPMPGGVGLMTRAMLLANVVEMAQAQA